MTSQADQARWRAFHETVKEAWNAPAMLSGAVSGMGAAAPVGALVGGGINAYRHYNQAKQQGLEGGAAAFEAAKGGLTGAAVGAGIGGLAGAGIGAKYQNLGAQVAHLGLSRDLPVTAQSKLRRVVGAPARFMQRQLHGLTGIAPEAGIESIGGGMASNMGANANHPFRKSPAGTGKAVEDTRRAEAIRQAANFGQNDPMLQAATKARIKAEAAHSTIEGVHNVHGGLHGEGLNNLPDLVHNVATHPIETLSRGAKEMWVGQHPLMQAATVGLPALDLYHGIAAPEDGTGPGRAERIGGGLASTATGLVSGALPISAQVGLGMATAAGGKLLGRGVDRLRGYRPTAPPPPIQPAEYQPQ